MGVEKEERGEERKRVVESLRRDSELVVEVVGSALAALEAGRSLEEVGRSLEERSRSEDLVVAVVAASAACASDSAERVDTAPAGSTELVAAVAGVAVAASSSLAAAPPSPDPLDTERAADPALGSALPARPVVSPSSDLAPASPRYPAHVEPVPGRRSRRAAVRRAYRVAFVATD